MTRRRPPPTRAGRPSPSGGWVGLGSPVDVNRASLLRVAGRLGITVWTADRQGTLQPITTKGTDDD